jgi:transaldolase
LPLQIYERVFTSERFKKLADKGARPQRLLWASTGSKDPAFTDVKYVEALIGPNTVNTVPMDTLLAFLDHGVAAPTLQKGLPHATQVLEDLKTAGINLDTITQRLEKEGIDKFNQPYDQLLNAIENQQKKVKV